MLVYTAFENKPLLFSSPEEVISCSAPSLIRQSFDTLESFLDKGYYIAGFLSYEAGAYFERPSDSDRRSSFPLLHLGCFRAPQPLEKLKGSGGGFRVYGVYPSVSFEEYRANILRIRDFIAAGDVYQITYCLKQKFGFSGDPVTLFQTLLREQPVPYPAYIGTEKYTILSLSPEMFVKKRGASLETKPMKGTWPRGNNLFSDLCARYRFKHDEKNRAENLMITDLLRNDLGRIGQEVRVPRLFEVSSYTTLHQMTSTVIAETDPNIGMYDLFKAVFPSGSVTGAPKLRAMEIIRDLEREDRGIYTGAIGYITPGRDLFFNVPIRTLCIKDGQGEMGVGGGIIWDSTPQGEWAEGMLKSKFLADHCVPS